MNDRHAVVAVLSVREGQERAFEAYERKALNIAARYGGRMERRIRAEAPAQAAFEEVHVLSFPTARSFAQYAADPELRALAAERAEAIASTTVVAGREQPLFSPAAPAGLIGAVDHVYLAVSDMARSEAFYDRVFGALGLHKGNKAIAGERHAHYFGPNTQLSLRPARSIAARDSYAPGLHHLCLQAPSHPAVDQVFAILNEAGVPATRPKLYPQYSPDYYATFFEDPDGIRLEVVARTAYRDTVVRRWPEFQTFLNPLAHLEGEASGVFHIAAGAAWYAAKQSGSYTAPSLSAEGFIHCSLRAQVIATANTYFRGQADLVLLQIDATKLEAELRYEPPLTMTFEIFPHLYGPLNLDAVVAEFALMPDADGSFSLPEPLREG
jgi:glyoxylase I family protein